MAELNSLDIQINLGQSLKSLNDLDKGIQSLSKKINYLQSTLKTLPKSVSQLETAFNNLSKYSNVFNPISGSLETTTLQAAKLQSQIKSLTDNISKVPKKINISINESTNGRMLSGGIDSQFKKAEADTAKSMASLQDKFTSAFTKLGIAAKVESELHGLNDELGKTNAATGKAAEATKGLGNYYNHLAGRIAIVTSAYMALSEAQRGITEFAEYESGLSKVKNLMGASDGEIEKVDAFIKKLMLTQGFDQKDIVQGFVEYGQAGKTASQSLELMASTAQLARAGGISFGEAVEYIVTTTNQFNLNLKESLKISELFIKNSNASAQSVQQFAKAFTGSAANEAFKGPEFIEEQALMVTALAEVGFKGSQATIAVKNFGEFLARAEEPTKRQKIALEQIAASFPHVNNGLEGYRKGFALINPATHSFFEIIKTLNDSGLEPYKLSMLLSERAGHKFALVVQAGIDKLKELNQTIQESPGALETSNAVMGESELALKKLSNAWSLSIEAFGKGFFKGDNIKQLDQTSKTVSALSGTLETLGNNLAHLLGFVSKSISGIVALIDGIHLAFTEAKIGILEIKDGLRLVSGGVFPGSSKEDKKYLEDVKKGYIKTFESLKENLAASGITKQLANLTGVKELEIKAKIKIDPSSLQQSIDDALSKSGIIEKLERVKATTIPEQASAVANIVKGSEFYTPGVTKEKLALDKVFMGMKSDQIEQLRAAGKQIPTQLEFFREELSYLADSLKENRIKSVAFLSKIETLTKASLPNIVLKKGAVSGGSGLSSGDITALENRAKFLEKTATDIMNKQSKILSKIMEEASNSASKAFLSDYEVAIDQIAKKWAALEAESTFLKGPEKKKAESSIEAGRRDDIGALNRGTLDKLNSAMSDLNKVIADSKLSEYAKSMQELDSKYIDLLNNIKKMGGPDSFDKIIELNELKTLEIANTEKQLNEKLKNIIKPANEVIETNGMSDLDKQLLGINQKYEEQYNQIILLNGVISKSTEEELKRAKAIDETNARLAEMTPLTRIVSNIKVGTTPSDSDAMSVVSGLGPNGSRAASIVEAGVKGGPEAALAQAILSNKKVQEAIEGSIGKLLERMDSIIDPLASLIDMVAALNDVINALSGLDILLKVLTDIAESIGRLANGITNELGKAGQGLVDTGKSMGGSLGDLVSSVGGGFAPDKDKKKQANQFATNAEAELVNIYNGMVDDTYQSKINIIQSYEDKIEAIKKTQGIGGKKEERLKAETREVQAIALAQAGFFDESQKVIDNLISSGFADNAEEAKQKIQAVNQIKIDNINNTAQEIIDTSGLDSYQAQIREISKRWEEQREALKGVPEEQKKNVLSSIAHAEALEKEKLATDRLRQIQEIASGNKYIIDTDGLNNYQKSIFDLDKEFSDRAQKMVDLGAVIGDANLLENERARSIQKTNIEVQRSIESTGQISSLGEAFLSNMVSLGKDTSIIMGYLEHTLPRNIKPVDGAKQTPIFDPAEVYKTAGIDITKISEGELELINKFNSSVTSYSSLIEEMIESATLTWSDGAEFFERLVNQEKTLFKNNVAAANQAILDAVNENSLSFDVSALSDIGKVFFEVSKKYSDMTKDISLSTEEMAKVASQRTKEMTDSVKKLFDSFYSSIETLKQGIASYKKELLGSEQDLSTSQIAAKINSLASEWNSLELDPEVLSSRVNVINDIFDAIKSNSDLQKKTVDNLKTGYESLLNLAKSIKDKIGSIRFGEFNVESTAIKYDKAQKQYEALSNAALTAANTISTEDDQAITDYIAFTETFLKASQDNFKSSQSHMQNFLAVSDTLDLLAANVSLSGASYGKAISDADIAKESITGLLDGLTNLADRLTSVVDAAIVKVVNIAIDLKGDKLNNTSGIPVWEDETQIAIETKAKFNGQLYDYKTELPEYTPIVPVSPNMVPSPILEDGVQYLNNQFVKDFNTAAGLTGVTTPGGMVWDDVEKRFKAVITSAVENVSTITTTLNGVPVPSGTINSIIAENSSQLTTMLNGTGITSDRVASIVAENSSYLTSKINGKNLTNNEVNSIIAENSSTLTTLINGEGVNSNTTKSIVATNASNLITSLNGEIVTRDATKTLNASLNVSPTVNGSAVEMAGLTGTVGVDITASANLSSGFSHLEATIFTAAYLNADAISQTILNNSNAQLMKAFYTAEKVSGFTGQPVDYLQTTSDLISETTNTTRQILDSFLLVVESVLSPFVDVPSHGDGGQIFGASHSNGGVMINAEGGEYVIRRDAVNSLGIPFLDSVNNGNAPAIPIAFNNTSSTTNSKELERKLDKLIQIMEAKEMVVNVDVDTTNLIDYKISKNNGQINNKLTRSNNAKIASAF